MTNRWGQHLWRLLPGIIAAVAIAVCFQGQVPNPLEQWAYQSLFQLRGPIPLDERLVIVAIDDVSLRELGRFPWPRYYYTQLLDHLTDCQTGVVAMTVLWSEPSNDDDQLAQALQRQGAVVLAQAWDSSNTALVPVPELAQSAIATGHLMRREDPDGLVRYVIPRLQGQPALAVATIQAHSQDLSLLPPLDLEQPLWLNWSGSVADIPTYPFVDVLQGHVPKAALQNKIVLVGATAAGLDPLVTPFDRNPPTSGVYLHATAINNLLQGNALRPLGGYRLWFILLVSAPGLSWLMARWSVPQQILVTVGLGGSWGLLSLGLFQAHYWLPTATPILLLMLTAVMAFLRDRLQEEQLLRRQVTHLWRDYHQDLLSYTRTTGVTWEPAGALARPKGAVPQVAQLAELAQQLGRSQAMQIAIARSLPVGLLAADSDGLVWFANPVASQLFAIQVGGSIQSAIVPRWLSGKQWHLSLEKLKAGRNSRYSNLRQGSRWFNLSLQSLAISETWSHSAASPGLPGILVLLEEVTEHKQTEAALKVARESALRDAKRSAETSRAKGDFLAHMSHELRTPLNVILGFIQVIDKDSSLHLEHRNYLKIINRSGQHLLKLINDVLEMSKIEAGRIQLNETQFDLYQLLDEVKSMVQIKAQTKGLELLIQASEDLPKYLNADEGKLRQILLNLVGNAIKFTEAGHVVVRVRQIHNSPYASPLTLAFEIEDTGIGIAAKSLGQLFQPFTQINASRHTEAGTGLGLVISQQFVRLMGGEISVKSILGQGSCFQFYIQATPVTASSALSAQDQVAQGQVVALAPNQPSYRILIVENHRENSQLLAKVLTPLGFQLRFAQDGKGGLALWKHWQPHLILMDLRMPVMNGVKAIQAIRSLEYEQAQSQGRQPSSGTSTLPQAAAKRTKIIALTATPFEETKANGIAIDCDDFLRKPVQGDLLLKKIAKHLSITYLYQFPQPSAQAAESLVTSEVSSAQAIELLAKMPRPWIQELHDLAIKGADRPILALIEKLPPTDAPMVKILTDWLEEFNFEEIIQFTQLKL